MNIYTVLTTLVWFSIPLVLTVTTFVVIYFSIKSTAKKARQENMSKVDFKRDVDYYRDILKEHSIAALSYIDDFQINVRREITATLLNLCLKKKIEIAENDIRVLDSNLLGLKRSEKSIMQNIIDNGKVQLENEFEFKQEVEKEVLEDNLIEKNSKETIKKRLIKKSLKTVVIAFLFIIIFAIFCNNVEKLNALDEELLMLIAPIIVIVFWVGFMKTIFTSGFSGFTYLAMQLNSYKRTEKGEEINKKIEGLKQYIKDYSILLEAEKEALQTWEEYLIYSIIFDINTTGITEELFKFIEIKREVKK